MKNGFFASFVRSVPLRVRAGKKGSKRRIWPVATAFLLLAPRLGAVTAVAPTLGDGTPSDPFRVATLQQFYWIAQNPQHWGASFVQTASIDASETGSWDDGDGGSAEGWTPIGNTTNKFHGFMTGRITPSRD